MKYIVFFVAFLYSVAFFSQDKKVYKVYTDCPNASDCFQLVLYNDLSFKYYISEIFIGKDIVEGNWKTKSDTLFLNVNLPIQQNKTIIKKYDCISNDSIQKLRFFMTDNSTEIILNEMNVVINDTDTVKSDSIGIIYYRGLINKVEILHPIKKMLSDTLFHFDEKRICKIDFLIPVIEMPYLTKQAPNKWIIRKNEIIAFRLIGNVHKLDENFILKRVSRKKILSVLK